jgi:DNA repair protein RadD
MLRPYQFAAAMRTVDALTAGECPILTLPTGGGKTHTAVSVVRRLDRPTLWFAHRKELVEQAAAAIETQGLHPSIIMAGQSCAPPIFGATPIYVASLQTAIRRNLPADIGLIVVDECHHAISDGYRRLIKHYNCPMLGLTATPFRLDGRGLGAAGFTEIIVGAYTDDLVAAGWLHAPKVYAGASPDLRGVRVRMGDYDLAGLSKRMDALTGDIVETWKAKTPGRRTLAFAVNVDHSLEIVRAFRDAGIPAGHVDGNTPKDERAQLFADLQSGKLLVLVNCMVATEGTDIPAAEVAIIARPTASLCLHLQMIGRIMRICEGKDGAVVLDHAGNHHVHGLVTRRIEYSLDGKIAGESEPLGLRRCCGCGLFYEPSLPACPECGWAPEAKADPRYTTAAPGELVEFRESYRYRLEFWRLIEAQRKAYNYKPGWSAFRYKERFGEWPTVVNGDLVDTEHATMEQKKEVYRQLLDTARQRGFADGWAAHKYRDQFGTWPRGFVGEIKAKERLQELCQR